MKADGSKQSIMGSIGEFLLKIYAVLKILFKLSRVGTGNIHCLKRYVGISWVTFDLTEFLRCSF